jgi:hypothetical protein
MGPTRCLQNQPILHRRSNGRGRRVLPFPDSKRSRLHPAFVHWGRRLAIFLSSTVVLEGAALTQLAPRIFFSDLMSGPNAGGENNNGAYVTIYGANFGASPTVTVGGGRVLVRSAPAPWLWYQKLTIQLGPAAQTGNIFVSTSSGTSNGIRFTIRAGNIYFVSTSGKDTNSGTLNSPWRTLVKAVRSTGAGAIIYAMDGVKQTTEDGEGWGAAITLRTQWCQGTEAVPKALIAYPGALVTIGNSTGSSPVFGLRTTDFSGACSGNWVFAGLQFRGQVPVNANGPSTNWRFIGNDISNNPTGGTPWQTTMATYVKCLGNYGHDINLGTTDRLVQGFYLSTDSNHAEVAWNVIANAKGRSAIQIHSSPVSAGNGYAMYDISIHDNVVHDIAEEGIIVDTVDPSKGPVTIYNNVVYNVGQDGHCNGAIYRAASSDFNLAQGVGSGIVDFYNNTIFNYKNCPAFSGTFEVHVDQLLVDQLRNNLIYDSLGSGQPYFTHQTAGTANYTVCSDRDTPAACPWLVGSHNLFYGGGALPFPNLLSDSLNQDPQLANVAGNDAHLQATSPAAVGGTNTGQPADIDGVVLFDGYPIGAHAYTAGAAAH